MPQRNTTITINVSFTEADAAAAHRECDLVCEDLDAGIARISSARFRIQHLYDTGLWRALRFDTWEDFVNTRFARFHRSTIFRALSQSVFERETPELAGIPASHAAVLMAVPPEDRASVYRDARSNAEGDAPTAVDVKAALERYVEETSTPEPVVNADTATSNPGPNGSCAGVPRGDDPEEKTAAVATNDRDAEKRKTAIEALGRILGKNVKDALSKDIVPISTGELVFWAGLSEQEIRDLYPLVMEHRWKPKGAHRWLNQMVDAKSNIGELQNRANLPSASGLFYAQVDGAIVLIVTTNKKARLAAEELADKYAPQA